MRPERRCKSGMDGGLRAAVLLSPPLYLKTDDFLSNQWGPPQRDLYARGLQSYLPIRCTRQHHRRRRGQSVPGCFHRSPPEAICWIVARRWGEAARRTAPETPRDTSDAHPRVIALHAYTTGRRTLCE